MEQKPGSAPRIAVAFFGVPRSSDICFPSIQIQYLGPLGAFGDVKVFYHFYRQDRIDNPRSGEAGDLDPRNYIPFQPFAGELECPGAPLGLWRYAELREFGDTYADDGRSLANLVHQLHSLRRVTLRLSDWNPDVVVYLRPDLLYHDPVERKVIQQCLRQPRTLYLPSWQPWGGRNDRFAVCGAMAYRSYGRRIERAKEFCEAKAQPLHAERLLDFALVRDAVRVETFAWRASRVRLGGIVRDESFVKPSKIRWHVRLSRMMRSGAALAWNLITFRIRK